MPNNIAALRPIKEHMTILQMIEKKYEFAIITGHLGKEVETRMTSGGKTLAKTSMAVSWGKRGENQTTEWVNLLAWNDYAAILAQFGKGNALQCWGPISTNSWQDRNGNTRVDGQLTVWGLAKPIWTLDQAVEEREARQGDKPSPGATKPGSGASTSMPPESVGTEGYSLLIEKRI